MLIFLYLVHAEMVIIHSACTCMMYSRHGRSIGLLTSSLIHGAVGYDPYDPGGKLVPG